MCGLCIYLGEEVTCDYAHHFRDTCVGLSDRKHPLIQVSGEWVKESSTSVCVHLHAGVVAASDNMLTHQRAHIQVTSSHTRENGICSLQYMEKSVGSHAESDVILKRGVERTANVLSHVTI